MQQVIDNNIKTAAEAARTATALFDIPVLADTIRKLVKRDQVTVCRSGPKGKFSEEEMGVLEVAVLSYVLLLQANCAKEKTSRDLTDLVVGKVCFRQGFCIKRRRWIYLVSRSAEEENNKSG